MPSRKVRRWWQRREWRTLAGTCSGERQVGMKGPALGFKAGGHRLGLDEACQLAGGFVSVGEPQPDHPREPAAPKRPHPAEAQIQPWWPGSGQTVGDPIGQR